MTKEEAIKRKAELDAKWKKPFCPIVGGLCRTDCVCRETVRIVEAQRELEDGTYGPVFQTVVGVNKCHNMMFWRKTAPSQIFVKGEYS